MTIRVVIADDQQLVRAGFRKILEAEDGIEVLAEASNGARGGRPLPGGTGPTWC